MSQGVTELIFTLVEKNIQKREKEPFLKSSRKIKRKPISRFLRVYAKSSCITDGDPLKKKNKQGNKTKQERAGEYSSVVLCLSSMYKELGVLSNNKINKKEKLKKITRK